MALDVCCSDARIAFGLSETTSGAFPVLERASMVDRPLRG